MFLLLLIFLAGYAVKCDESNYYVIEMPSDDPPTEIRPKERHLQVYWNVPTMQCTSKKVPFENLNQFGIIQNFNDRFRGERITILYDPGFFPALLRNDTSGKLRFRNGGVPQEGDLDQHLSNFKSSLELNIPDENFSGIGIIDFESWRPIFRQNFGEVWPYKSVSYKIEEGKHFWWPDRWIRDEARRRFEEAARIFMQNTISVAKQMRPYARWGYYGFPYCFNMASNNMRESCADKVNGENDQIYWLWAESTALYPSVYSPKNMTASQLSMRIRGRVKEAARVRRRDTPILPYFWFRYQDGEYLRESDLHTALETFHQSEASGFIIWGSSKDVNTFQKCQDLHKYIYTIFGPAIAKYTKSVHKIEGEANDEIIHNNIEINGTTTTEIDVIKDDIYNITIELTDTDSVTTDNTILETSTYVENDILIDYFTLDSNESLPIDLFETHENISMTDQYLTKETNSESNYDIKNVTLNDSEYNEDKNTEKTVDQTNIKINKTNLRIESLNLNELMNILLSQILNFSEAQNQTNLNYTITEENVENITSIYDKLTTDTSTKSDSLTTDPNINDIETNTKYNKDLINNIVEIKQDAVIDNEHTSESETISTENPISETSTHIEIDLLMTNLTKSLIIEDLKIESLNYTQTSENNVASHLDDTTIEGFETSPYNILTIKEEVTESIIKVSVSKFVTTVKPLEATEEINFNESVTTTATKELDHHIQLNDDSKTEMPNQTTENHLDNHLNYTTTESYINSNQGMKWISRENFEITTMKIDNNLNVENSSLEPSTVKILDKEDIEEDKLEYVTNSDILNSSKELKEVTEPSNKEFTEELKHENQNNTFKTTESEKNIIESYTTESSNKTSNQDTLLPDLFSINETDDNFDNNETKFTKTRRKDLQTEIFNDNESTASSTVKTEEFTVTIQTTDSSKDLPENMEDTTKMNIGKHNNDERSTKEAVPVTSAPESLTSGITTKQVDIHFA